MYRLVLQTNGMTPLYIASHEGHVECVRALLDGGAAIDQAKVCGAANVYVDVSQACLVRWDGTRLRFVRVVVEPLSYSGRWGNFPTIDCCIRVQEAALRALCW